MRRLVLRGLLLGVTALGPTTVTPALGETPNACLAIHGQSGPLPNGGSLCQNPASGNICTFNFDLCVNEPDGTCVPASFAKRTFHASGHCGPVGNLEITPSGTGVQCGQVATVKVHTRGKHAGKCTVRAAVRTATTHAHTAVRTVQLTCQPSTATCPSTTTTTATTSTTTTTTL